MDLILEIAMALGVLLFVLRACWQGNPRPCFWTAIGASIIAVAGALRHLETSDIVVPALLAIFATLIGRFAHTARRKEAPEPE